MLKKALAAILVFVMLCFCLICCGKCSRSRGSRGKALSAENVFFGPAFIISLLCS